MIKLESNLVTCFDVDDTLIEWEYNGELKDKKEVEIKIKDRITTKYIIEKHVEELIRQKESGALIIVWSASGYEWAQAVITALNLNSYVDVIASKPVRVYDDKDPQDWMPKRRYLIKE